jgi:hypothetical protein
MQTLNCVPGDLAVTVASVNLDNIGNIVEVLYAADPAVWRLNGEPGHLWWARSLGRPLVYSFSDGPTFTREEGPVPDRCLRPIRSEGEPDAVAIGEPEAAELEGLAWQR